MFRIGEFSKISGLSIDTLYHYEKMNILKPEYIDKMNGYRYYEANQLVSVNKIMALKDSNLTLEEIAEVMNKNLPVSSLIEILEQKSLLLEEEINEEKNRLERLRTNIFLIKNGGIPQMNEITIKKVESILIASIRKKFHSSRFDEELTDMWKDVNDYIELKGGKKTVPCMMLYHTGWGDMDETSFLDVETAEPITREFDGDDNVGVYRLNPEENMACIVHKGPFSTISVAFDELFNWISNNGYKRKGPIREIYHKGDWATEDPQEYITELQVPIELNQ